MLLSISSSKPAPPQARQVSKSVVVLVLAIIVILAGLEVFTRAYVEHRSRVQREVNREYNAAIRIRHSIDPNRKHILIVGNSLLGHGIDMASIERDLPPGWQVNRFWIYNTGYEDWYFGLQRLFAEGARPEAVAVVFAALHWYANGIRGEYSSQYMFESRDIPRISSELDLDRTTASSLLFARYSKFFALRSEIRKAILMRLVPDLPNMYALFKPGAQHHMQDRDVLAVLTKRIEACRSLTEKYGASLILIVPPIPRARDEHQDEVRVAAKRAGVELIMPMSSADTPQSYFADDIHLNPEGARVFSSSVSESLALAVTRSVSQTSTQVIEPKR